MEFKIEKSGFVWRPDDMPPAHEPENCDACERGDTPESCKAFVEVSYPSGSGSRRIQRFTSCGLYGICGADTNYRREVQAEEWHELVAHCEAFGVYLSPHPPS